MFSCFQGTFTLKHDQTVTNYLTMRPPTMGETCRRFQAESWVFCSLSISLLSLALCQNLSFRLSRSHPSSTIDIRPRFSGSYVSKLNPSVTLPVQQLSVIPFLSTFRDPGYKFCLDFEFAIYYLL